MWYKCEFFNTKHKNYQSFHSYTENVLNIDGTLYQTDYSKIYFLHSPFIHAIFFHVGNPHDVLQCPSCGSALIVQLDDHQGAPGWQRTASTPIGKHTSPIGTSPRGSTTLSLSPRKSLFIKWVASLRTLSAFRKALKTHIFKAHYFWHFKYPMTF